MWDTADAIVNFVDIGFVLHGECFVATVTPMIQHQCLPDLSWSFRGGVCGHLHSWICMFLTISPTGHLNNHAPEQRPFSAYYASRFLFWES